MWPDDTMRLRQESCCNEQDWDSVFKQAAGSREDGPRPSGQHEPGDKAPPPVTLAAQTPPVKHASQGTAAVQKSMKRPPGPQKPPVRGPPAARQEPVRGSTSAAKRKSHQAVEAGPSSTKKPVQQPGQAGAPKATSLNKRPALESSPNSGGSDNPPVSSKPVQRVDTTGAPATRQEPVRGSTSAAKRKSHQAVEAGPSSTKKPVQQPGQAGAPKATSLNKRPALESSPNSGGSDNPPVSSKPVQRVDTTGASTSDVLSLVKDTTRAMEGAREHCSCTSSNDVLCSHCVKARNSMEKLKVWAEKTDRTDSFTTERDDWNKQSEARKAVRKACPHLCDQIESLRKALFSSCKRSKK